jgi:hypothetical protein
MKAFRMVTATVCICLFAGLGQAFGAGNTNSAINYFGHIEAPCVTKEKCDELKKYLNDAAKGTECSGIDKPCDVGEKILDLLFGSTHRENLPDFIVYFDDSLDKSSGKLHIKKSRPLLMWQGKNTPHLLGVRSIYVMVFSNNKLDNIRATVTSDYQYQPNPLIGILTALKIPEIKGAEEKKSETAAGVFAWSPLSGNADDTTMWLGIARIDIAPNTINRVTVSYLQPKVKVEVTTTKKNDCICKLTKETKETASKDECVCKPAKEIKETARKDVSVSKPTEEIKTTESYDINKNKYESDFLGVTGHFSNTPANYAAVSLALGATFNTKDTAISSRGTDTNFNGFVLAKFYPYPCLRPYLYATQRWTRYKPSLGLVIGTNVNGKIFDEIVVGVSAGHLIGNIGFILGANYVAGVEGKNEGRKPYTFFGLEYTF